MVMKKSVIFLLCIISLFGWQACGRRKARTLSSEYSAEAKAAGTPVSAFSEKPKAAHAVILDTVTPSSGIKYKESRAADPANPPVKLDFTGTLPEKDFPLGDYYGKVRYVTIKHPGSAEGRRYLDGYEIKSAPDARMIYMGRVYSRAMVIGDRIFAGDDFFGWNAYDTEGNFLYNVWEPDLMPTPDTLAKSFMDVRTENSNKYIISRGTSDNYIVYSYQGWSQGFNFDPGERKLSIHELSDGAEYYRRPLQANSGYNHLIPVGRDMIAAFPAYGYHKPQENLIYTFDMKGDTLCAFKDVNPPAKVTGGSYSGSSGNAMVYVYDAGVTVRPPFDRTIYRMKGPDRLVPAYELDFGERHLELKEAINANAKGKMVLNKFAESDKFVYIEYSLDYDSPYNRRSNKVEFFYAYYDKADGKLWKIPYSGYPENLLLDPMLEEGIPVQMTSFRVEGKRGYMSFTKSSLEAMAGSEKYRAFGPSAKEKLQELYEGLEDGDILVAIYE